MLQWSFQRKKKNSVPLNTVWTKQWKLMSFFFFFFCSSEHLSRLYFIYLIFFFFLAAWYLNVMDFFSLFFSVAIWSISCVCQSPLTILRGPQERSFVSRLLIKKVIVRFIVIGRQKVKLAGAFQFTFTGSLGMYEQQVKKAEILSLQQPAWRH